MGFAWLRIAHCSRVGGQLSSVDGGVKKFYHLAESQDRV
jgi:hypothetical protein